jgi:hypothetical protein
LLWAQAFSIRSTANQPQQRGHQVVPVARGRARFDDGRSTTVVMPAPLPPAHWYA